MKRLVKMISECAGCDHSTNNSKDFDAWVCKKTGKVINHVYDQIDDSCELPDDRREED